MFSVKSDGPSIEDMVVSAERGSAKVEFPMVAWEVMPEVMMKRWCWLFVVVMVLNVQT